MRRSHAIALVLSLIITAVVLAFAPLFAQNPISNHVWAPNSPVPKKHDQWQSHKPQSLSNEPDDKGRPEGDIFKDAPNFQHPSVPVGKFPPPGVRMRYEGVEVWRSEEEVMPVEKAAVSPGASRWRPAAKPLHRFEHKAEYMEQQLIADYSRHPLASKTFVMIKTGAQTQWSRMPTHLWTTLTKIPYFGIYSDQAGSIAGYEIINILRDLPKDVHESDLFKKYWIGQQMAEEHWSWDPADLNLKGGWDMDKYKNMPMLYHAYKTMPDAKWYFFIDDDTHVFWDNLYSLLETYDSNTPFYLGSPAGMTNPRFPFAHGGSGVVLSQGAMFRLFNRSDKDNKKFLDECAHIATHQCCGDGMVAIALDLVNVHLDMLGLPGYRGQGLPFFGGDLNSYAAVKGCESSRPITLHHVSARQAEILYEYEKARGSSKNITMFDMYRDFVLPYITDRRPNWTFEQFYRSDKCYEKKVPSEEEASDPEDPSHAPFTDDGKPLFPYGSEEKCLRACELDESCYQWTYRTGVCRHVSNRVYLGTAMNKYKTGDNGGDKLPYTSGWMIDRIRHMRAEDEGDPLKFDEETKKWNDDETTSEGWYIRAMQKENYKPTDQDSMSFQF